MINSPMQKFSPPPAHLCLSDFWWPGFGHWAFLLSLSPFSADILALGEPLPRAFSSSLSLQLSLLGNVSSPLRGQMASSAGTQGRWSQKVPLWSSISRYVIVSLQHDRGYGPNFQPTEDKGNTSMRLRTRTLDLCCRNRWMLQTLLASSSALVRKNISCPGCHLLW